MRALTIKQPFAAHIADGHKTIEYRSWAAAHRGPLLITASSSPANCRAELDDGTTRTLPAGCLVCVVDLVDITGTPGDYHWHLTNPRPVEPRPVKGRLNIWEYHEQINYLPAGLDWLDYKKKETHMAGKKSIYLSTAAENVIGEITESTNLSGRINSIITRYGAITAKDCPELTENEWMMICDILNGTMLDTDSRDADPARFLWADIAESGQLDGMAAKWSINTDDLSQRVRGMTYSQQVAIIEIVQRFWSGHSNLGSYAEILKTIGAKVAP